MAKRLAKKVLIIGWDAADWNIINPLIEKRAYAHPREIHKRGLHG